MKLNLTFDDKVLFATAVSIYVIYSWSFLNNSSDSNLFVQIGVGCFCTKLKRVYIV